MGVTIGHCFNSIYVRKGNAHWTWLLTTLLFITIMWLSSIKPAVDREEITHASLTTAQQKLASAEGFQDVHDIVLGRCSMCHGGCLGITIVGLWERWQAVIFVGFGILA